jgi:hypothetical protein
MPVERMDVYQKHTHEKNHGILSSLQNVTTSQTIYTIYKNTNKHPKGGVSAVTHEAKKKAKICFVIYIAGKRILFLFMM